MAMSCDSWFCLLGLMIADAKLSGDDFKYFKLFQSEPKWARTPAELPVTVRTLNYLKKNQKLGQRSVDSSEPWRWGLTKPRCVYASSPFKPVWLLWWKRQQPYIMSGSVRTCACCLHACVCAFAADAWALRDVLQEASLTPAGVPPLLRLAWHVAGHRMYNTCSVMDCSRIWWIIEHALCLRASPHLPVCHGEGDPRGDTGGLRVHLDVFSVFIRSRLV